jgi:D-alanyl-D-alanine carboxypeptidase (penicillin-binding protein 5/6)
VPPAPVPAGAKAWLLMDYDTGQILAGENIDARMEPASITKVMTSYVVAAEMKNGKIKPDDLVTMSERAWREGGAGTEGSFSGFELNSRNKLSDVEKGPVGAVGQRRRDRARRAHRRQRRVLRLAV